MEAAGIPHAFGGALALALYAESRETADIDVNVFVPAEQWPEVREALVPLGVDVDVDGEELKRQAEVKVNWDGIPVHLFFSSDLLHEEMPRKVRQAPLDGRTIPLVAPEHLIVRKKLLNRPKDRRDIEAILAHTSVDQPEVDAWVRRLSS